MTITLCIPGKPIAKKRPRFFRKGTSVGTYNAQETEEGRFMWEVKNQLPKNWTLLKSPIKITTLFYMKRPKSHYGAGKNSNILKNNAPVVHLNKPDLDNLQKMVYDCFNQIVWEDDSIVCECYSRKEYSEIPRTEILITEVTEDGQRK